MGLVKGSANLLMSANPRMSATLLMLVKLQATQTLPTLETFPAKLLEQV